MSRPSLHGQPKSRLSLPLCPADIVFLIFLYQRWCYPVDKTRRNEFQAPPDAVGEGAPDDDGEDSDKDPVQPALTAATAAETQPAAQVEKKATLRRRVAAST